MGSIKKWAFCTIHTLSSALLSINLSNIKKFWKNLGNTAKRTHGHCTRSKNAIHCAMGGLLIIILNKRTRLQKAERKKMEINIKYFISGMTWPKFLQKKLEEDILKICPDTDSNPDRRNHGSVWTTHRRLIPSIQNVPQTSQVMECHVAQR